jgi:K+-sensing histidine kinase KdpD
VGLGLVTANDLVASLAGHMTIKSQKLKGTTVEFALNVTNKEVKINVKSGQVEKLVKEVESENRGSLYL